MPDFEISVDTTQAQQHLAQAMQFAKVLTEPTAEARAKVASVTARMSIDEMLTEAAVQARKAANEIDRLRAEFRATVPTDEPPLDHSAAECPL